MSNTAKDRYRKRNYSKEEKVVVTANHAEEVEEEPLSKEEVESVKEAEKDYENGNVLTTEELTKKLDLAEEESDGQTEDD